MEADNKKNIVNYYEAGANCQVFNGNITGCVFAMPGSTVTQQGAAPQPEGHEAEEQGMPALATLIARVDAVRDHFWSDSAMAVIFCVCRDCFGYGGNMRQFERDFDCQEGLLSNTFRNNPYMRLNISKWAQQGAKARVLQLVEAYKHAVDGDSG